MKLQKSKIKKGDGVCIAAGLAKRTNHHEETLLGHRQLAFDQQRSTLEFLEEQNEVRRSLASSVAVLPRKSELVVLRSFEKFHRSNSLRYEHASEEIRFERMPNHKARNRVLDE